jgi:hypothetical protein
VSRQVKGERNMNRILSLQALPTQKKSAEAMIDSTQSYAFCSSYSLFEECEAGYDVV